MIKKLIILGVWLFTAVPLFAQETEEPVAQYSYAAALNGSSLGFGAEFAVKFTDQLSGRLRFNYLNMENLVSQDPQKIGGETFLIDAGPKSTEADIVVEYLPFKGSSFKVVGGFGYFFEGDMSVYSTNKNGYTYGSMHIEAEDIGKVVFKMDYSGLAPYLGIGFGRAVPKNLVGVSFEMGTFYLGEPKATIGRTELLAENTEVNLAQFQEDISDYRWYPYINLRVAINLTK